MLTTRRIANAIDLLQMLDRLGVKVYKDGFKVRVAGPPDLVTADLRRELKRRHLEVFYLLNWIEDYERRRAQSMRDTLARLRTDPKSQERFLELYEAFRRKDAERSRQ